MRRQWVNVINVERGEPEVIELNDGGLKVVSSHGALQSTVENWVRCVR